MKRRALHAKSTTYELSLGVVFFNGADELHNSPHIHSQRLTDSNLKEICFGRVSTGTDEKLIAEISSGE